MKDKTPKPRKCKICKQKYQPEHQTIMALCSPKCIVEYHNRLKEKRAKKEHKELKIKVYEKENKKYLQDEINKLSRLIDLKFGYTTCIDCNKPFNAQTDAAHYHSRGANSTLRYHLDNLHSARSNCNQYSDTHKSGYAIGLIERYGKKYADYVMNEMPLKYSYIKLSPVEVYEKLALVRKLIRDFDSYKFESSLQARKQLNKIIGIYA